MKLNDKDISIIEAGVDDSRLLADIIRRSFTDVAVRFGLTPENAPTHPSNCRPEWVESAMEKGVHYWLLYVNDEPSGCAALEEADSETGYLERLAVLPDVRRSGLGGVLVDYVFKIALKIGLKRLEIGIIADQLELERFYLNRGFREKGRKTFPHLPFDVLFMSAELRTAEPHLV